MHLTDPSSTRRNPRGTSVRSGSKRLRRCAVTLFARTPDLNDIDRAPPPNQRGTQSACHVVTRRYEASRCVTIPGCLGRCRRSPTLTSNAKVISGSPKEQAANPSAVMTMVEMNGCRPCCPSAYHGRCPCRMDYDRERLAPLTRYWLALLPGCFGT